MDEQMIKEKEYLQNIYKGRLPRNNPFIMNIGDGKEVFVMALGDNTFGKNMDMISQYRSLYDTVLDLKRKIAFSLNEAIEKAYSEAVLDNFGFTNKVTLEEWYAYYYAENAIFRIEALWDILAQIYNLKYSLEADKKHVMHSRIFSKQDRVVNRYWKGAIPDEISEIADYIAEDDDTSVEDGMWKGNYAYVNSLRNNMTHQISISNNSFSSYAFSFKEPPSYMLKRVTECYAKLEDFIYKACENVMDESEDFKLL